MGLKCRLGCQHSVYGRKAVHEGQNDTLLFSFPANKELRNQWIQSTGLTNLGLESMDTKQLKQYRVCFQHFKEEDIYFKDINSKFERVKGKF